MQQQTGKGKAGGRDQQAQRRTHLLRHQTPHQAAGGHGAVEYHLVDRKRPAPDPVRQDGLRGPAQRGEGGDPGAAQQQEQQQRKPYRWRGGEDRHHGRGGQGRQQHHMVRVEALLQARHRQRAKYRAQADRAQQDAVETGATVQQLPCHQRQQRPHAAAECKVARCTPQHHVQLAMRPRKAQARAEGAEKVFAQRILGPERPLPPDQRGDHDEVARHVERIGCGGAEGGQQQAAGGRPDGPRDVHAERVQSHRALELPLGNEVRHDGLPGRPHHGRTDATKKDHGDKDADRECAVIGQRHQHAAHQREPELDHDQESATVQDVRQHACGDRQHEDRQRRRGLDHGDRRGRGG